MALTKAEEAVLKKLMAKLSDEDKEALGAIEPKSARKYPLGKPGPNKFETSPHFNKYKKDTKIDKLLWGDNSPEERRDGVQLIEAECTGCGKKDQINPLFAYQDNETRKVLFVCDNCTANKEPKVR